MLQVGINERDFNHLKACQEKTGDYRDEDAASFVCRKDSRGCYQRAAADNNRHQEAQDDVVAEGRLTKPLHRKRNHSRHKACAERDGRDGNKQLKKGE